MSNVSWIVECGWLKIACCSAACCALEPQAGSPQHATRNMPPRNMPHATSNAQKSLQLRRGDVRGDHSGDRFHHDRRVVSGGDQPEQSHRRRNQRRRQRPRASNYAEMLGNNGNMVPSYAGDVFVPQVLALPSSTGETAVVDPGAALLFQALSGNIISQDDPRYAWVPFYFRGFDPADSSGRTPLPYAQLILICVQATNYPTFSPKDLFPTASGPTYRNLRGRPVRVVIVNSPAGTPDYIGFEESASKEQMGTPPPAQSHIGRRRGMLCHYPWRHHKPNGYSCFTVRRSYDRANLSRRRATS